MPTLDQIEKQVERLLTTEKKALLEWLEDLVEDELEVTDEFKAKVQRAKPDIAEGGGRVVKSRIHGRPVLSEGQAQAWTAAFGEYGEQT